MIIREIRVLRVTSDPDAAVIQINSFLQTHPTYGLISYEIIPHPRAVFGRYEELPHATGAAA
jgi:hypothetical protein